MEFVWCFENSNALHISMAVWRLKFVFCNNFSHCIANYSTDDFISKLSSHTALRIHMCLLWCAAQLHTDWCLQLLPEHAWRICVVQMWYSNLDYNSPQIFRIGCWAFALWSIMKMCCEFWVLLLPWDEATWWLIASLLLHWSWSLHVQLKSLRNRKQEDSVQHEIKVVKKY